MAASEHPPEPESTWDNETGTGPVESGPTPKTGEPTAPAQTPETPPEDAGLPVSNALLETLLHAVEAVQTQTEALRQGFESKIRYDASKDKIIDSLHRDLQACREDLHFKILRPMFLDLIAMYDDLCKLIGTPPAAEEEGPLRGSLASFVSSIEETLARNGVTAFNLEGDEVVQQRQRVVETVPTADARLDLRIAERRRKGFAYDGKILRPELVTTYRHIAPIPQASEENP